MNMGHWILDENRKPKEVDLMEWAKWIENRDNKVSRQTKINGFFVSSVFLGLDHDFGDTGVPVLWETMVFDQNQVRKWEFNGKEHESHPDVFQERYTSEEEMLKEHDRLVEDIKAGKDITNY